MHATRLARIYETGSTARTQCRGGALLVVAWIVASFWACGALFAEDQATTASRTARSRQKARTERVAASHQTRLEDKLEKVLANQQAILQKFDAIQEELRIIKVRASSRGAIAP